MSPYERLAGSCRRLAQSSRSTILLVTPESMTWFEGLEMDYAPKFDQPCTPWMVQQRPTSSLSPWQGEPKPQQLWARRSWPSNVAMPTNAVSHVWLEEKSEEIRLSPRGHMQGRENSSYDEKFAIEWSRQRWFQSSRLTRSNRHRLASEMWIRAWGATAGVGPSGYIFAFEDQFSSFSSLLFILCANVFVDITYWLCSHTGRFGLTGWSEAFAKKTPVVAGFFCRDFSLAPSHFSSLLCEKQITYSHIRLA